MEEFRQDMLQEMYEEEKAEALMHSDFEYFLNNVDIIEKLDELQEEWNKLTDSYGHVVSFHDLVKDYY